MAKAMSGLVSSITNIIDLTMAWNFMISFGVAFLGLGPSSELFFIGVMLVFA